MGFKDELLINAGKYIAKNISKKKHKNESKKKKGGMNKVTSTLAKMEDMLMREEGMEIEKKEGKKYMIFQGPQFSIETISNMINSTKSNFEIYDEEEKIKFKTKTINDTTTIYDRNSKKIGYIIDNTNLINIGNPLNLEFNVEKCSVFLGKKLICKLKSYKTFGDYFYETYQGDIKLEDELVTHNLIKIIKENKIIATLRPLAYRLSNKGRTKYMIEYDNDNEEKIIASIVIGLYIVGLEKGRKNLYKDNNSFDFL